MMTSPSSKPDASLRVFTWNVANPSPERAALQAPWLRQQSADVLVLTEVKNSQGCVFLERYFQAFGYEVAFPKPDGKEYGVMVVSRLPFTPSQFGDQITYLPTRVVSVMIPFLATTLEVIGIYVPSRDGSPEKKARKRQFTEAVLKALHSTSAAPYRILCGDFNVLEPNHFPHYAFFEPWEYAFYSALTELGLTDAFRLVSPDAHQYSWVGRTGEGYRYDHCFVSTPLVPLVQSCYYFHDPRIDKRSDHSAVILDLATRILGAPRPK